MFQIINLVALLLLNIIGVIMAYWVYGANSKKNNANSLFLAVIVCMIVWTDFNYLGDVANNEILSLYYKKMYFSLVSMFFIFIYIFAILFPEVTGRRNIYFEKFTIAIWSLFSVLILFTDLVIKGIIIESWGVNLIGGAMMPIFYIFVTYYVILVLYILIKKYYTLSYNNKKKILYFIIGLNIYAIFQLIFNVFIPTFYNTKQYWQFGDYSAIFFLGLTAYAIVKHELMGIKTLFTQVLIIIMSIILIVDIMVLSGDFTIRILKIAVLLTFLYFSREMVRSVKKEKAAKAELEKAYDKINGYVDQLEGMNTDLAERNDDLKALLEASGKASEALDPKKIAQDIVNSIPKNLKHLGYLGGMIALYDAKEKKVIPYAITKTKIVDKILKYLDKPFDRYSTKIGDADNLISRTILEKSIFSGNTLAEFIEPTVKKEVCDIMQKMLRAHSIITIPLISRGKPNGMILFMGKRSIKEVAQRDKDMLYMFSSHVGAAIENAKLYEQTNEQMKETARLNKKLENANENLKDLLEVKNEFLHITSHQLRTPLTAIRGMLSMWYEGDFDNLSEAERKDILKRIYMSTERLNNITNDMLDALEIEGGLLKFQFIDMSVKEIVEETIDTLKDNYDKKGLYIKFNCEENLPKVRVEPNYIRQVFMNVVDNAAKYTKAGGVEITTKQDGKYIETVIKDTGVGASKDDQKRLFEKFTRGKNAVKENASGSGLGLFIAKKIVEKHHGKMKFFSEGIGMGSTVTIFLPVKKDGDDGNKDGLVNNIF